MSREILIVEDNIVLGEVLSRWIGKVGFGVDLATHEPSARRKMDRKTYSLVLTDVRLPKGDGLSLLEWSMAERHGVPFVVMTDYASVPDAVRAVKMGAEDYLPKPVHEERLVELLGNILGNAGKAFGDGRSLLRRRSPQALAAEDMAKRVAGTDWSVMILGPNGSGKESVAHTVHRHSRRKDKPFVAVNCGAVPKELAASELFGHVKGAFTGADGDKDGYFKAAHGGTLFLDEIGNMHYEIQSLLLRVLQEKEYCPVGSRKPCKADVRVVSATNADLASAISDGSFREDLYHRLCEFEIRQPPLRECPEDVLSLAEFFLNKYSAEMRLGCAGFTECAKMALLSWHWPGNIRELANRVRRGVLLTGGGQLSAESLDLDGELCACPASSLKLIGNEDEKRRITAILDECRGNVSRAAELLGCSRPTLYKRLRTYGMMRNEK